ncbi:hypothetical protein DSO57_1001114 [Entomophthora muscae]|uniref:Uncharacterized protein n=1 Tax=Entomophthora muscae TaxID=34485 RepID=A0ACC2SB99_9FUNG|nr:hypothetical protein DSO57_1001114 [Entomophthora muscae]
MVISCEKDLLAEEVPNVTKEQLTEFLNGWFANGPQSEFLASLGHLVLGLFGSNFGVARLDQVEFPDFLNFCKVVSSNPLEAELVGKAMFVSGYQEYCGAPEGESGVEAGTGMAHQMMGPNFTR